MTNPHINKLGMYLVVLAVLDKFAAVVATIPALVTLVESFRSVVGAIQAKSEEVDKGTYGETKAKLKAGGNMTETIASLVGSLHSFAAERDDEELMHKSDVSESDIDRKRDAERAAYATSLTDLVEEHKTDLVEWGISDVDITEARAAIKSYKDSLDRRDSTRTNQEGQRETIDELFSRGDRILVRQMDKLVKRKKSENPDFVAEYVAARVIKDIAATRSKPTNGDTPQPGV
ncbi:MAG: hypothetical protein M1469_02040 [Bacteroidetes bacterium]|nr:hypothetical protein [Bacteroidota bacterium]